MRINKENYITQLRRYDEKALEFVLEEYGGLLMSIIRKHLFCLPGLQEECMNDVLFKIWKHIDQFDENRNSFKNWIAGIARYQAIDYLRKHLRELELMNLDEIEEGREDEQLVKFIEEEISDEVEAILACLNQEDRAIFLKLFYEDKDVEEVSREIGLKKEIIYNRVSRGKRKIRWWNEKGEEH